MISISATGLSQLLGSLAGAARITPAAALAVRASGETIAEVARAEAPVLTGALRDSITAESSGLEASVGPTVDYAPFVEYGTYKDAPQPFMEQAAEAGTNDLAEKLLLAGSMF